MARSDRYQDKDKDKGNDSSELEGYSNEIPVA